MSTVRAGFRRSAVSGAVIVLALLFTMAACGSSEPAGITAAKNDSEASTSSASTGTRPPSPVEADGPPAEEDDSTSPTAADAADFGDEEPCVTVVTTIPGQRFCDGYQPFPDETEVPRDGDEASNGCPDWVTDPAPRPSDGWLGTEGDRLDFLARSGTGPVDADPTLTTLIEIAAERIPPEFELLSSRAEAVPDCLDDTLTLRAVFSQADGSQLLVLVNRLIGQFDWTQQPPSGLIERSQLEGGAELATANYSNGMALRVWVAQPDGALVRVVAFGANVPTYAGYPTTIPSQPTSDPPTPVPMSLDQLIDLALTVANDQR